LFLAQYREADHEALIAVSTSSGNSAASSYALTQAWNEILADALS
jgi:hypothetical protein